MSITCIREPGCPPDHASRLSSARPRVVPSLIIRLSAAVGSWIARSQQRQALRELAECNDHLLKDIGLSRQEALREAGKPFWR